MKRKRIVLIVIAAVVVIVVATAGIYFATSPAAWRKVLAQMELGEPEAGGLTASGFIEAEEVSIAPELGGRVVELLVDEGDEAEAGQVLVRLDGALLEAQIEVVQATLDVAQSGLAQAVAGARPEQIRQAEATLAQAEAARDGAYQAWQDSIAIRDNPQELDAQIAQVKAQVAAAEAALAQAVALKDAAQIGQDAYDDALEALSEAKEQLEQIPEPLRPPLPGLPMGFHFIPNAYWKSWVGVNTAGAAYDGAVAALNDLYAIRNNPQELNGQVDAAEAQYRAAEAAVQMAQAQVDALRAGATEEEIAIAEAQVEQAQAALDALMMLHDKQTIVAPVGGLVLERSIHEGELAAPGATLLTLGDLDQVTLTVYVPENRLGQVLIGQRVEVRVDSFPERVFTGTVVAIAHEAEFTPRNVQTQEERVNMVFAV
ncbi:MAG: efflux RND transporter periplasmic adaptor subunit, partial [Chloroflexi bacterium]|nr:efflux RND transporter periplasmic adaptor subunit [Chloroflexota bacterium]